MPSERRQRYQRPYVSGLAVSTRRAAPRFGHQESVIGFPSGVVKTYSAPAEWSGRGSFFRISSAHGSSGTSRLEPKVFGSFSSPSSRLFVIETTLRRRST